ncbi:MAG: TIGR02270 family protein [Pseudomonadota bacterium]|nr:TIGR02270 family protein [Pseudomonadota bacterium]
MSPGAIPQILERHLDDLSGLINQRFGLVHQANGNLTLLGRMDERIAAHLDALRINASSCWPMCKALLESPGPGEMCVATLMAIELDRAQYVSHVLALAESLPETQAGAFAAFDWLPEPLGTLSYQRLLASDQPFWRLTGLAASAQQRTTPSTFLSDSMRNNDPRLQARMLQTVGEQGLTGHLPWCTAQSSNPNPGVRLWASWSATLLGSQNGLKPLGEFAIKPGPFQQQALSLLLKAVPLATAHKLIQSLSQLPENQRAVIKAVALAGDPFYVPWLMERMGEPEFTRLAGESFSFITGVDLAYQDLERKPPEDFESGPNDDPDDPNVDLDEDDDLPWPDVEKVARWWWQHSKAFAEGTRYFMGKPVTGEHCLAVLKSGFQRQRVAAAEYLCLLSPGTPLFPTAAPTWRQQALLQTWPGHS